MSDIQGYISNLYSSSAESMIPTYSTAGFTSSESLLGKRQSSDVGSRATPSLPTYNANAQYNIGNLDTEFDFRTNASSLLLGAETPIATKSFGEKAAGLDLKGTVKAGKDLYESFQVETPSETGTVETGTGDVGTGDGGTGGDPGILGSEGGGTEGFEGSSDAAGGASGGGGGGLSSAQLGGISAAATALGAGIETLSDDQDPTKWNVGEASGSILKGAGKGAALGTMIAPGIGTAIGAGVGAVTNFVGGLLGRNKARKDE